MLTQDQLTKIKLQKIQSHLNYLGLLEDLESLNLKSNKSIKYNKLNPKQQMVINQWKQYLTYEESNKIFSIFASSKLAKEIVNDPFTYMPDYINKLSFKSFGIEYEHLIIKFIANGLLPKNFFDLK